MGELLEIKCEKCGKTAELRVGYGLMHGRLENVTTLFPDRIRSRLPLKEMQSFEIPWSFRFVPAVCGTCRSFVAVPSISLKASGKPSESFPGVCPDCGGDVVPLEPEGIEAQPCPSCGQAGCSVRETGMWD